MRPSPSVGRRLRRDGQLAEAEKIFRACLLHNEHDAEAWVGLSAVFADQSRFREAAYCLWKASRLQPHDLSTLDDLGRLLVLDRDYERASRVFDDLIRKNPTSLQAYIAKSAVERLQDRIEQSRQTLLTGVRRNPVVHSPSLIASEHRILRVYGAENSYYVFVQGSGRLPRASLELGHYSTEYFWNPQKQTTIDCHIPGEDDEWQSVVPDHDIMVNTIADPDVERGALKSLARFIDGHPATPIINRPHRVLATTRDENYRRLRDHPGIRFPKTLRLARAADGRFDLGDCLNRNGLDFPLILREPGSHSAQTTILAETPAEAETYFAETRGDEIYIIEFILERFRTDFYRKMRVFFIDGEMYPVVHHVDRIWNVHGFNRKDVMANADWMMDLERTFVTDPVAFLGDDVITTLHTLPHLVGLDFFGIDFTVTERGDILVYEMNPAMRHSFDHAAAFPYLRPSLKRISDAFMTMVLSRCGDR